MANQVVPVGARHGPAVDAARALWRRRALWACVVGWTVFVGVVVWWLLRGHAGPTVWIVHDPDALQRGAGARFRGFFKADLGFERIYPWLLLGPYVALVASFFPLG